MILKEIASKEQITKVLENEAISFMTNMEAYDEYRKYINKENTFGLFDDETLYSSLSIFPYYANLNNNALPIWGIGHVATFPEYREKGYFKILMKSVFKDAVRKGIPAVSLFPYCYELYRNLGFIELFWTSSIQTVLENIKDIKNGQLFSCNMDLCHQLQELYSCYIKDKNGCEIRNLNFWKRYLMDNSFHTYIWYDNRGKSKGYVMFEIVEEMENRCKVLKIKEIIYDSEITLSSMLGQLKKWYPRVKMINWSGIGDVYLPRYFKQIRNQTVASQITTMFRVIDIKKAIQCWNLDVDNLRTIIKVNDKFCEWNSEPFELTINNGKAYFMHTTLAPEIEMNIETFTQMYFGAISYEEALNNCEIKIFGSRNKELSSLFQKKTIKMFESF